MIYVLAKDDQLGGSQIIIKKQKISNRTNQTIKVRSRCVA